MDQAKCLARKIVFTAPEERTRIQAITYLGEELNVQQWIVEEAIADGTPVDTFRAWCCNSALTDAGSRAVSRY